MDHSSSSFIISPYPQSIKLDKTLKLGVMASGSGSNFEAIARSIDEGELNAKIELLIYNNPEATVKK